MGLDRLTTHQLSTWVQQATTQSIQGEVIERIPCLAKADPRWFAVHICCHSGTNYSQGDTSRIFPLMSVIKVFSLLYLLEHIGAETVFQWVGIEPTDAPFNSLEQLIADRGYPRNPMINSGAITLADKLPGRDATERTMVFCQWLNQLAGCHLQLDTLVLASVRLMPSSTNQAIARYLIQNQRLKNPDIAIDTYEQICSLSGTVADLAQLGKLLASEGDLVKSENRRIVNALMLSCGLYQASTQMALRIGLPMKSGIGGGLLTIVPSQGAIACYSPALDRAGNSVAGLAFVEALSQGLQLSIFG